MGQVRALSEGLNLWISDQGAAATQNSRMQHQERLWQSHISEYGHLASRHGGDTDAVLAPLCGGQVHAHESSFRRPTTTRCGANSPDGTKTR